MRFYDVLFSAVLAFLVFSTTAGSSLVPTRYDLELDVSDINTSSMFNGTIHIDLDVTSSDIMSVELLANGLLVNKDPTSIKVSQKSQFGTKPETPSGVINNGTVLTIKFPNPLITATYRFSIPFRGLYQGNMTGFAKVEYSFRSTPKYLGVTRLEPHFTSSVFPCLDYPYVRVQFTLSVVTNQTQLVLTNVPHTMVQNISGTTTKRYNFTNYPTMPISKLGWVVLERDHFLIHTEDTESSKVQTRALYPYSNYTGWASHVTARLVDAVGIYTGQKYPLSMLEQLVVPEFFIGTAEAWGLVTYSEETLLISPSLSSTLDIQQVVLGLAGGVARQWFGGNMSPATAADWWFTVGLSEFLKYQASASLKNMSGWELTDHMVVDLFQPALHLDSRSQPALVNAVNPKDIEITKYKGGALIRMVQQFFGDAMFKEALQFYLKEKRTYVSARGMWETLYSLADFKGRKAELPGQSVDSILQAWTNTAGYPVLNVTSNGTHFNISQPKDSHWFVPVIYLLQGGRSGKTWLLPASSLSIPAAGAKWIVVNANQTGFYRVSYSNQLLDQLTADVSSLPYLARSQLIDDLFSLLASGSLSSQQLLTRTSFLHVETDYFPWYTVLRNYQTLIDRLYGQSSYERLQDYLLQLMSSVIANVGVDSKNSESHTDRLKRILVLEKACSFGHEQCIKKAVSVFNGWMDGTNSDMDLRSGLMCAAVANSSAATWERLWQMYDKVSVPSARPVILKALTCSKNITTLNMFLDKAVSRKSFELNSKDKTVVLQTLASSPFGADVILKWLVKKLSSTTTSSTPVPTTVPGPVTTTTQETVKPKANLRVQNLTTRETTTEKLEEVDIVTILTYIVPKLTSLDQGTKLEKLITENKGRLLNATLQLMKTGTEKIYKNNDLAEKYNADITTWLNNAATDPPTLPTATTPATAGTVAPTKPSDGSSGSISLPVIHPGIALFSIASMVLIRELL